MTEVIERQGRPAALQELLAGYDDEVQQSLRLTLGATTGSDRVRALHNRLSPAVAVHDAVVESVLCPLLANQSGGADLATRLRAGCRERADLLGRFDTLIKGVAPRNVYPASGDEVEQILEGLARSIEAHVHDEAAELSEALTSAEMSADPGVVAARMAAEAGRAPTRAHRATSAHPTSAVLGSLYRWRDSVADWVDTHHGWSEPGFRSPRAEQVEKLEHEATEAPLTVSDLLAGYDASVDTVFHELRSAESETERAEAAHRLSAAITIHDSVLGGVLCPLVAAVPGGGEVAERLQAGCRQRAELLTVFNSLARRLLAQDVIRVPDSQVERIVELLTESFALHERDESAEVVALLERLPEKAYRHRSSPFADFMWPWHSEGPSVLALRMAMWARSSPTRPHPLFVRHPSSRVLRSLFHFTDRVGDRWRETPLERWLSPPRRRPFSHEGRPTEAGGRNQR